jgi:hypothetical protein
MAWTSTDTLNLLRTLAPYVNQLEAIDADAKTLTDRVATIVGRHSAYGALDSVESVEATVVEARRNYKATADALIGQCQRIITDRDLVVSKLPIPIDSSLTAIVQALVPAMGAIDFAKAVTVTGVGDTQSTVSFDTAVGLAQYANTATARQGLTTLFTFLQDGVNAPRSGVTPVPTNVKKFSQSMQEDETFTIEVALDAQSGGRLSGQELLRIYSNNQGSPYNGRPGSSGSLANLVTSHVSGETLTPVAGMFPTFTGNVPDGWTVVTGTPGTHFEENTSDTFRGASSLYIAADATFQLTKDIAAASLVRDQLYFLYYWYLGIHDTTVVDGSPQVSILGTNASLEVAAGSGIDITPTEAGGGEWQLGCKLYRATQVQPNPITKIQIVGDGSNEECCIASVGLAPVFYYGGLGMCFIPGVNDPLAGVRFQLQIESEPETYTDSPHTYRAGGWARFFNKALNIPVEVTPAYLTSQNPPYDQVLYGDVRDGEDLDTIEV